MTGYFRRWTTFFCGSQNCERFVPFQGSKTSFRSHLAWAKRRNVNLKELATQRCLKSTTVVALIINTNLAILYNPSEVGDEIRAGLKAGDWRTMGFWIGIASSISLFLSVFALIANYTAYSIFNSLSTQNAPIILRSSIGRYTWQKSGDLVNHSMKSLFVVAALSYIEIAQPGPLGATFATIWAALLFWCLLTTTSLGHTIIHTGAMGHDPILRQSVEENMGPDQLSDHLLHQMDLARKAKIPLNYQYQIPFHYVLKEIERGNVDLPIPPDKLNNMRESQFTRKWHRY
ncbi:expressed unknown protein [Seminavis robusta]|uniref:Uncharacterized protein n=1 Tax=Seminavis robusta TaxID=568900 RepID=A0A9N8H320_9STRA|nr:expressed unknown protein [Seminavis robusta]|eukprot:Sro49_g028610.1 n/a (288) ;mRNA; r:43606-44759